MGQVLVVTEMLQTLQKQSTHEVLCSENDGQKFAKKTSVDRSIPLSAAKVTLYVKSAEG